MICLPIWIESYFEPGMYEKIPSFPAFEQIYWYMDFSRKRVPHTDVMFEMKFTIVTVYTFMCFRAFTNAKKLL